MNNKEYHIDKKNFFADDSLLIEAPALIIKFIVIRDYIIMLLDSNELNEDKNIFSYSQNGQFLWQIREVPKLPSHTRNYFTSIYVNENCELQAYNINGVEVTIDLNFGTIQKKELIR